MRGWEKVYRIVGLERFTHQPVPSTWILDDRSFGGFPPALIPLWHLDESVYWGLWCHCPALNSRSSTFVEFSPERQPRVREIARTFEQLAAYAILREFSSGSGDSTSIRQFAEWAGVRDVDSLDRLSFDRGSDEIRVRRHIAFGSSVPLESLRPGEAYDGDFPSEAMQLDARHLASVCSLELGPPLAVQVRQARDAPPWLVGHDPVQVAIECLRCADPVGAWMATNSSRMPYADARRILADVARRTDSELCSAVVEAWCAQRHEKYGSWIP